MADPDRADEMESIVERYGEVQARFEELDGYALEGRAREVLAGLGFSQEMMDGDVGALSGGWKMRVALGPHPADAPRRHAARRAEQPSRPRKPDLARGIPQGLRGRAADDLARPRVHEPHRHQDRRDRRRRADHLFGQLRVLRAAARAWARSSSRPSSSASRRCSPRRSSSSSASRRAPRTPRRCRAGSRSSRRSTGSSRRSAARPCRSSSCRRRAPARTWSA